MVDLVMGDRVRFVGTVKKDDQHWGSICYIDAPLPGFDSFRHDDERRWVPFRNERDTGIVVGERTYTSKEYDEGIWVADSVQKFAAYLVAYHLRRNPVIVRLDQIVEVNGVTI